MLHVLGEYVYDLFLSSIHYVFLQVRGEVEKLAHITDSILSKTEQVFAVVQGLDIGGVVKLDGKGSKNNYTIKETVKNENYLYLHTYIGYKRNLYLLCIISDQNSVIMCHIKHCLSWIRFWE